VTHLTGRRWHRHAGIFLCPAHQLSWQIGKNRKRDEQSRWDTICTCS
jgi:hypothetical protein